MLNTDLEGEGTFPPAVEAFRQKIKEADSIFFASPEYNYSVTGTPFFFFFFLSFLKKKIVLENWYCLQIFSFGLKFMSLVEFILGKFQQFNLYEVYRNDTPQGFL